MASTAASQARTRMAVCWPWGSPESLRGLGQAVQVGIGVAGCDGGEPGVEGNAVGGGSVELGGGLRVGGGVCQGEPVPELPELGFLGLGEDAVGHGVGAAELTALFEGEVDGVPVSVWV